MLGMLSAAANADRVSFALPLSAPGASAPPAAGLPLLGELLPAPTQRSQADRGHLSTCAVHPF